jgi:hypothetical protein
MVKQLINSAMKGKSSDLRMFREAYRQACEKAALSETANPPSGKRAENLTDDQLAAILFAEPEKQKKEYEPIVLQKPVFASAGTGTIGRLLTRRVIISSNPDNQRHRVILPRYRATSLYLLLHPRFAWPTF